ncbi:MAG: metallophosphoesterase [Alphaproteobacteria bacterium]|nr:metallophosphoesterase [Alphaproteobacteria bacterium]
MRIIQVSDTHLSPGKRQFAGNWPPLAAWIADQAPDLVIHTGDVTVDGADIEEDLRHAAALMRSLGVRFRAVPGNHDVGDPGHPRQPVTTERLGRWRAHFGPDRWFEDTEGVRLIGLNAMLLGSGEAEEEVQAAWLDAVMDGADGRRTAWFLHRPLFIDSPDEPDTGYWSVKPQSRARLLELARRHSVALIASGHLHRAHEFRHDGCLYLWAPASAFLVGPGMNAPPMPGENRLGAVVYTIDAALLEAEIVHVPGLVPYLIDDVVDEVYPRPSVNGPARP